MDARKVVCAAVSIDPAQTLTLGRSAARIAASNIRRRAIIWEREYRFAALLLLHGKRIRILDIDAPKSQQTCKALGGSESKCRQWAANRLSESEKRSDAKFWNLARSAAFFTPIFAMARAR